MRAVLLEHPVTPSMSLVYRGGIQYIAFDIEFNDKQRGSHTVDTTKICLS